MRRAALLGFSLLLSGCSGLGDFLGDTATLPGQNPNHVGGVSENVDRARGRQPAVEPVLPQQGDIWPGPPQPLPTLSDVAKNGGMTNGNLMGSYLGAGRGGASLQNGGSMSLGEQDSIRHGVKLDNGGMGGNDIGGGAGGFSGGGSPGSLESSVPDPASKYHSKSDSTGNIVIPNGDGSSTVISPDGTVKTVKGTPK